MKNALARKVLTLAAAACLVGGYAAAPHVARAQDAMPMKEPMKDDGMMMQHMEMMKKMMSDPAMMPSADDMAKATAMHEMASMMAKDPECKKMCMSMMKDGKMMAPAPDAVKAAKEAMMKDPAMMKMAMAHAMTMSMAMEHPMGKMDDKMPMK